MAMGIVGWLTTIYPTTMDTDARQHPRMNTDQVTTTIMDMDLAHRQTEIMVTVQGAMDTAYRPITTMDMDQGTAMVMDMDQGTAMVMDMDQGTAMTAHRPAPTMVMGQRPVTAMETAQDLATVMDTAHSPALIMDTAHRPVTDAPLERQPIHQTVMRLSRSRYRTYPRLLLVNNDRLARKLIADCL
jgi:hypothetical protein